MFVWRKTHEDLKTRHNTLIQENLDLTSELRNTKKAFEQVESRKNVLEGEAHAHKKNIVEMRNVAVAAKDKAQSMFARAGGYAGQYSTLVNKILKVKTAKEFKELQIRLAASKDKRARAAAKGKK